jgi:hypothetical protein
MIETTINEFKKFTDFIEKESPKLSAKLGVMGKKDAYKLNQSLCYKRDVAGPNYTQSQYPVVDLLFSVALGGGLYVRANDEKGRPALIETSALESYKDLNSYEKYTFLLQTYWAEFDFRKFDSFMIPAVYYFLKRVAAAKKGQRIIKEDKYSEIFYGGAAFVQHLRFFGFSEIEEIKGAKGRYEDSIRAFIPNELGISISDFLIYEALPFWNSDYPKPHRSLKKEVATDKFDVFRKMFADGFVTKTVDLADRFDRSGVYTFKVSLAGDCWRQISVSHRHTLADLHLAIQGAFNFDDDHLYAFYVEGDTHTGKPFYCEYAAEDEGEDAKTAEETTIEEMALFKGQKLCYLFDFGDEWLFDVTLIKIDKNAPPLLKPLIVKTKGEPPEQYGGGSW